MRHQEEIWRDTDVILVTIIRTTVMNTKLESSVGFEMCCILCRAEEVAAEMVSQDQGGDGSRTLLDATAMVPSIRTGKGLQRLRLE